MKLIIDISDEHYRNVCKRAECFGKRSIVLAPHEKAIANGIPLSEELEKIKAEIREKAKKIYKFPYEESAVLGISDGIIDNHIAESKGDTNDIRRSDL